MSIETNLGQTEAATPNASRRGFLRNSSLAAAGLLAVPLIGSFVGSAEAGTKTIATGKMKPARAINQSVGQLRARFLEIQDHENAHVDFLVTALGSAARPKPTFKELGTRNFLAFLEDSQGFENTGVAAYLGAAPVINDPDYLAAAASIMTVEARHSGFLNSLRNQALTASPFNDVNNQAFDMPAMVADVIAAVSPFVVSLNGGPALGFSNTPSDANDVDILNFALALEYLEAEFYNINVPRFF